MYGIQNSLFYVFAFHLYVCDLARLEEQQSFMLKELTSIKNSVSAMLVSGNI